MIRLARNPVMADRGRRIAGLTFDQSPPGRKAAGSPSPTPPPGDPAIDIKLPDSLMLLLNLSAASEGVAPAEIVRRAIPHYAQTVIGLQGLADAVEDFSPVRREPALVGQGARRFAEDGELIDLPAFARAAPNRFASGP